MKYKRFFQAPIRGYQYLSRMLPGSCRYYPTCSEYAKWQFEFNAPHKALLASSLRILRCNQLFEGGIDYPLTLFCPKKSPLLCNPNHGYGKIRIAYWLVPKKQKQQGSGVAMWSRRVNIHTPDPHLYYVIKDLHDTHLAFPA